MLEKAIRGLHAARPSRFLRFCVVGAVGFVVDAGTLLILMRVFGMNPIGGRLASFAVAVLTTFELNRRWVFALDEARPYLMALASYVGVQGLGFCFNFGIYTLLYLTLPQGYDAPLFCLTVASVAALAINYAGASLIVFRSSDGRGAGGFGPRP